MHITRVHRTRKEAIQTALILMAKVCVDSDQATSPFLQDSGSIALEQLIPTNRSANGVSSERPLRLPSREQLCARFKRRMFNGKGIVLVLFLNIVVNFSYYSTSATITDYIFSQTLSNPDPIASTSSAIQQILRNSFSIVFPIAGFIADVGLGRHSTIRWSMVIMWCGLAALSISVALTDGGYRSTFTTSVTPIPALLLLFIGVGGFKANIIPFGVDQMESASSDQISSYFYWCYWGINVGALLGVLTSAVLGVLGVKTYYTVFVATVLMTAAISLHEILSNWLNKTRESSNPLGLVLRIISYATKAKRSFPQSRRAFRYGEIPPPRIDLAKIDYDGKYSHEQVEDVKTFCLILLVYLTLVGAELAYNAVSSWCLNYCHICPCIVGNRGHCI